MPRHHCTSTRAQRTRVSNRTHIMLTNSAAMRKPFPELTGLRLAIYRNDRLESILPDPFLGGITCVVFHFRDYENYICLPLTSSILTLIVFPGTFHPR